MKRTQLAHFFVAIVLFSAAGLAVALTPVRQVAQSRTQMTLETAIPKHFGEWRIDTTIEPIMPNLEVKTVVDRIYSQTLDRTYINKEGDQIMLSIAYGGDQSDSLQVHLPEGCYRGQGFAVGEKVRDLLPTALGTIPVARLLASRESRTEPITYWVVVGDQAADSDWEIKKAKLRYALKREVPDGMLVRISSITRDVEHGFAVQKAFAAAMLSALSPEQRARLMGIPKV